MQLIISIIIKINIKNISYCIGSQSCSDNYHFTMTSNVSKGDPNFKKYIMEYGHYMNKATRVRILNLIMYHIEDNTETEIDHMQLKSDIIIKSGNGLNIDLDKLDDELLTQIYNIINRRMEILNTPYIEGVRP